MHLQVPVFLLLPHLQHGRQILIPRPLRLHPVHRLAQKLLHIHILTLSQQILDRRRKLGIQIARERMARVINQNPRQHDRIVVHMAWRGRGVRHQLANAVRCLPGGTRTRLCSFNDSRKMNIIGTLLFVRFAMAVSFSRTFPSIFIESLLW